VLLTGAGLLFRTLIAFNRMDVGFDPRGLVVASARLSPKAISEPAAREIAWFAMRDAVRRLPGVRGATVGLMDPTNFGVGTLSIEIEGRTLGPGDSISTHVPYFITPDYLSLTGIPLKQGRGFSAEGMANEVLINETFAQRFWPNESPLGLRIREGGNGSWKTIVGVVGDVRLPNQSTMVNHDLQVYSRVEHTGLFGNLIVRSDIPLGVLDSVVRRAAREVNPGFIIGPLKMADTQIAAQADTQRFVLRLIGAFALVAVLLAAVGLHGVISYAVSQRTREIGIRVALGAQASDITRLVLSQGLGLAFMGVVVGVAGAAMATRLLRSFLYGVQPGDPATFVVVAVVLIGVTLLATYLPARRAARLNPVEALRVE
jgi:putative ABC transport system permease protein